MVYTKKIHTIAHTVYKWYKWHRSCFCRKLSCSQQFFVCFKFIKSIECVSSSNIVNISKYLSRRYISAAYMRHLQKDEAKLRRYAHIIYYMHDMPIVWLFAFLFRFTPEPHWNIHRYSQCLLKLKTHIHM